MTNTEIIKKAQAECGEYVTGYRYDITVDSLNAICEAMWKRAKNLSYTFTGWFGEVADVLGKKAFLFWIDDIHTFEDKKMEENKYYMFHGERYCA
jgi:hypothetical protein